MEETTIKSLFEQFDGTYRKENDYGIRQQAQEIILKEVIYN